jgi:enoyl-CoA hydratase/carnithine racemase
MEECMKMVEMIKETGPIAVEQAKYAINYGMETDIHTGLAIESNAYWIDHSHRGPRGGVEAAFREKRKPEFKGR